MRCCRSVVCMAIAVVVSRPLIAGADTHIPEPGGPFQLATPTPAVPWPPSLPIVIITPKPGYPDPQPPPDDDDGDDFPSTGSDPTACPLLSPEQEAEVELYLEWANELLPMDELCIDGASETPSYPLPFPLPPPSENILSACRALADVSNQPSTPPADPPVIVIPNNPQVPDLPGGPSSFCLVLQGLCGLFGGVFGGVGGAPTTLPPVIVRYCPKPHIPVRAAVRVPILTR